MLATGDMAGQIILWDLTTHHALGEPIQLNNVDGRNAGWINTISFSHDGHLLATGTNSGKVLLLDVKKREPIRDALSAHQGEITKVVFSPVGNLLASSGSDASVVFWDLAKNRPDGRSIRVEDSSAPVYDIIFSPDGKTFATSTMNENVTLWDVATRQKIGNSIPHIGTTIAYSPDGRTIAAAGGRRVYFIPLTGNSSDGSTAATMSEPQTPSEAETLLTDAIVGLSLIDVDSTSWAARACQMANRELTTEEWTQFLRDAPYKPVCE
jgi:WD40 repeat protein